MANTRIIIYFFIIINTFIKCASGDCEMTLSPTDKYDCFDSIDEDDKDDGYHCCYRKETLSNGNIDYKCDLLWKDDYNDIDYYKKQEKQRGSLNDLNIECENKSNVQIYKFKYLIFSLLNLFV